MEPATSAAHRPFPVEVDETLPGPLGCKYDDSLTELQIQLVVPGIKEKSFTRAANTDVYIKTDSERPQTAVVKKLDTKCEAGLCLYSRWFHSVKIAKILKLSRHRLDTSGSLNST
ncbi:hypothetical protein L596_024983 [Steinernema carpocapsae]|uniref:Uncharacterized protein n=1 Tax=Steinernema carpocapsae TaxID=34508 RepID=A0A4U5M6G3_STECR|nr:hypothetical protein L596_024983 [Steinernema carpocapsae]